MPSLAPPPTPPPPSAFSLGNPWDVDINGGLKNGAGRTSTTSSSAPKMVKVTSSPTNRQLQRNRLGACLAITLIFVIALYHGVSRRAENLESELESTSLDASLSHTLAHPSFDVTATIHPQCTRSNPNPKLKNRPMIVFKYARTGSTWLAWTGDMLRLGGKNKGKKMVWTMEAEAGCGEVYSDGLTDWFVEYFQRERHGKYINTKRLTKSKGNELKPKCVKTALEKSKAGEHGRSYNDPKEYGPIRIATMDWKEDPPHPHPEDQTIDLTAKQWKKIFDAVPNLAVGVLVRTNSVKRAISSTGAEEQKRICGSRKLKGDEHCIKNGTLPDRHHLNTTDLWNKIRTNDRKRDVIPQMAAQLATLHGDGKIFCLSYEAMQQDLAGEMEALGDFLGANIDPKSIENLREDVDKHSYKSGSDDLTQYIENYDEVKKSLARNECVLEQLESTTPRNFPSCNMWQEGREEEDWTLKVMK